MQGGPDVHAPGGLAIRPDDGVERGVEALLREHPDALVCGLSGAGLITPVPKSVSLWGQTAIEGRAVIDHVVAEDRATVADMWVRLQREPAVQGKVRLLDRPTRWMDAHMIDLRKTGGDRLCVIIPAAEAADAPAEHAEQQPSAPRFSTLQEDERGNVLDCDEAFTQMFGYSAAELIGKSVLDQIHPDDQGRAVESWIAMLSSHRVQQSRLRRQRKDGTWMWVDLTLHNYLNEPDRDYVLVEIIDSSAEMATQEALQEQGALLRRLMDAMPDGLLHLDTERNVVFYNARLLQILEPSETATSETGPPAGTAPALSASGVSPVSSHTSTKTLFSSLAEPSVAAFEAALTEVLERGIDQDLEVDVALSTGEWRRALMSLRALLLEDETVSGAIATALDITDSARAREDLERRATFDHLTRCYNRPSILAELQRVLDSEDRAATSVVFVDLDRFKSINDTLGHAAGDEVLVGVVERLKSATRAEDKVGRLGGDEFLLLIHGLPQPEVAMGIAQRICELLAAPLELSCGPVGVTASIGVAGARDETIAAEALVALADEAMYRSKELRQSKPVLAKAAHR